MRWEAGKWVNGGFIFPSLILLFNGYASYQSSRGLVSGLEMRGHAHEVQTALESLLNQVVDAETGQRGYILTGKEAYLEPYFLGVSNTPGLIQKIRTLFEDQPFQQKRLSDLSALIDKKFEELNKTVLSKRSTGTSALSEVSKLLMDDIREHVRQMRSTEDLQMQDRERIVQNGVSRVYFFVPMGTLIALLILLCSAAKVNREMAKTRQLGEDARVHNKKLEAQAVLLRKATQSKSEFLANMSHELRSPLNAIIGFAGLMHKERIGPVSESQKEYLGDILASGRHLLQIINDILDLSKVEAGRFEFQPQKTDLDKLVAEVSDIMRGLAAEKGIQVQTQLDAEVASRVIDPSRLKQILYNYISNAIKFTPEGGKITVRLSKTNDNLLVEVEDTGIGIKEEDLSRLFVEFQQLNASTNKKYAGTGLGLSLTKRIVEAQGGRVGVKSVLGKGTVFTAIFPQMVPTEPITHNPEDSEARVVESLGPKGAEVLVVEDSDSDRNWIVQTLSRAGYRVHEARSGAEAIAISKVKAFSAMTLDLTLPDYSGWEILSEVRTSGLNQDTRVLILSASANKGIGAAFLVQDYLSKPVTDEQLLVALSRVCSPIRNDRPVLVIDDDLASLKLSELILSQWGYRIICKTTGEDGIQALASEEPALVILDLLLQGMSGFEFLTREHRMETGVRVPIIVWSMKDLTPAEKVWLKEAAQAVIAKGENGTSKLLQELRNYLRVIF